MAITTPATMDETVRREAADDGGRAPGSAGALLRAARERQGMHIATLAAAIKVAPRKLEALEQDRWDELPGPTFTRALAQAVCRALKADAQPVMELLPPADTSMLDSNFGTINEPFSGRDGRARGVAGWVPRGPWTVAAGVLLLAAALVLWWPGRSWNPLVATSPGGGSGGVAQTTVPLNPPVNPPPPTTGPAAPPAPAALPSTTPSATAPGVAAQEASPAGPAGPTATAPGAAQPGAAGATAAPGAGAGPAGTAGAAAAPAAAALPAGELVVQCSARSWIEVVDARGRVLLSRNLEAGEAVGIDGPAPLQVVVGNVTGTQISYKGRPVDLAPRARDNVARFELR